MRGSWTTWDRIVPTNLRNFDLKVGDEVIFTDQVRENYSPSLKGRLLTGIVVGIYPHIFHVRYYTGPDEDIKMYRSFGKVQYQLGEVSKYDAI